MQEIADRQGARQFARYLVSSGLTFATDFVIFIALYKWAGIPLALAISRMVAAFVGFYSHKLYSFRRRDRTSRREIVGYVCLLVINYLLSVLLMLVHPGNDGTLHTAIAKFATEIIIFVANFLVLRKVFLPAPSGE